MSEQARRLRDRLAMEPILLVRGVTNALYARVAKRADVEAVFLTGAGLGVLPRP